MLKIRIFKKWQIMNKSIGSNFDDFLADEGILAQVEVVAKERVNQFKKEQKNELKNENSAKVADDAVKK